MSQVEEAALELTDTHGFGFVREGVHLAVGIGYVLEMARHEQVRPLPRSDSAFVGYVIFRGQPLPVLDPACFSESVHPRVEGRRSVGGAIHLAVLGVNKKAVVGLLVDQVGQMVELEPLRETHRCTRDLMVSLASLEEQEAVRFIRVDRLFELYQLVTSRA